MQKNSDHFSIEQAKKLAESEAGKALLSALRAQNSQQIDTAMEQASAGDYEALKKTVRELAASPQVQALLRQFGG